MIMKPAVVSRAYVFYNLVAKQILKDHKIKFNLDRYLEKRKYLSGIYEF